MESRCDAEAAEAATQSPASAVTCALEGYPQTPVQDRPYSPTRLVSSSASRNEVMETESEQEEEAVEEEPEPPEDPDCFVVSSARHGHVSPGEVELRVNRRVPRPPMQSRKTLVQRRPAAAPKMLSTSDEILRTDCVN